jgi:hypothetical protein
MSKVLNCAVCLDDITENPEFLPCIHAFHTECINSWIKEKPLCPVCKVPIYISTPDQLTRYNEYKTQMDRAREEESKFFQDLSAGRIANQPRSIFNNIRTGFIRDRNGAIVNPIEPLVVHANPAPNAPAPNAPAPNAPAPMVVDIAYYPYNIAPAIHADFDSDDDDDLPDLENADDNANEMPRYPNNNVFDYISNNISNIINNANGINNVPDDENNVMDNIYRYSMLIQSIQAALGGRTPVDMPADGAPPVDMPADGAPPESPYSQPNANEIPPNSNPRSVLSNQLRDALDRYDLTNNLVDALRHQYTGEFVFPRNYIRNLSNDYPPEPITQELLDLPHRSNNTPVNNMPITSDDDSDDDSDNYDERPDAVEAVVVAYDANAIAADIVSDRVIDNIDSGISGDSEESGANDSN